MAQTVKASAYNSGDLGSIPGSGRCPGEGNGIYLHEIFDFFFIRNATDDRIVGSTSSRTVKLVYLRIP